MGKLAGAIDLIVRLIETVIQTAPSFKFQSASGKELSVRDLAGLARSIQAATSVPQGVQIDESDIKSLEAVADCPSIRHAVKTIRLRLANVRFIRKPPLAET